MKRLVLATVLAVPAIALTAGSAGAQDGGAGARVGIGVTIAIDGPLLISDLTFATCDLVYAARRERPSPSFAKAELALSIPLAIGGLVVAWEWQGNDDLERTLRWSSIGLAGLAAGLTVHGIWVLTRDRPAPQAMLAPAVLYDGTRAVSGLAVVGIF